MTTTHVLRFTYGTSRGRETYGYNIVRLTDETTGQAFRTMGGGYDMHGTVIGAWLVSVARAELLALPEGGDYYGMRRYPDGRLSVDGAAGVQSMLNLAAAVGIEMERTYNRKGQTTGYLATWTA
jgi:hypothetical protein